MTCRRLRSVVPQRRKPPHETLARKKPERSRPCSGDEEQIISLIRTTVEPINRAHVLTNNGANYFFNRSKMRSIKTLQYSLLLR